MARATGVAKRDFQPMSDDIPPQIKKMNMVIPILMHFCSFISKWGVASRMKPHIDVINDVKPFQTVCRTFLTSSNQTSRYKLKCIRLCVGVTQCLVLVFKRVFKRVLQSSHLREELIVLLCLV